MLKKLIMPYIPHDARRCLYALRRPEYFNHLKEKRVGESNGYSFRQFDSTRSIFIHIPKAAGVSVCNSLYGNLAAGHTRLDECEIAYNQREFQNFFKFTFVRNPWDRLYSAYFFLKKGGMCGRDRQFGENLPETFQEFVLGLIPEKTFSYIHFIPQTHFLRSNTGKELAVDFVGRYENLESDFDIAKQRVNPAARLTHKNKTDGKAGYREAYTPEMADMVRAVYAKDIELLGYSF